jgi:hypothetical protein
VGVTIPDTAPRTGLFRFVRWPDIAAFEARGWLVVQPDLGPTHGAWSVLMWHCECGACTP